VVRVVAGTYFCVSVACTTEPSRNPKSQFAASYYSDGDVHSYGFYAPYEYVMVVGKHTLAPTLCTR
jgi:hypothetical protein